MTDNFLFYIIPSRKDAIFMSFVYERTINYYETDRMGVVHHSNYIRFLEEARCYYLRNADMPFEKFEEQGITIPVLEVKCKYKQHVTFSDTICIKVIVKEFNGVRLTIGYEVKDKKTGNDVIIAETKHCFTDKNLRPINLKKHCPEFSDKFEALKEA